MTRFQRLVVSGVIGFVAGILGFLLVAIFFPLVVPLTLDDPHHNDTLLVLVGFGVTLGLFLLGFFVCWRCTQRFALDSKALSIMPFRNDA